MRLSTMLFKLIWATSNLQASHSNLHFELQWTSQIRPYKDSVTSNYWLEEVLLSQLFQRIGIVKERLCLLNAESYYGIDIHNNTLPVNKKLTLN